MNVPPFPLLYRDRRLLVLDKPPGAAISDRPADAPDLIARLAEWLGSPPFGVHRLDQGTSGALVVALDRAAATDLGRQFSAGLVRKTYLAFTSACPRARGVIALRIRQDPADARRFLADAALGKPARTRFRRLRAWTSAALLLVKIDTGRTHQIRVHLSSLGAPILGDRRYGGPDRVQVFAGPGRLANLPAPRLCLHAARLVFRHPDDGRLLRCRAPLPEDLRELLRVLNGKTPA